MNLIQHQHKIGKIKVKLLGWSWIYLLENIETHLRDEDESFVSDFVHKTWQASLLSFYVRNQGLVAMPFAARSKAKTVTCAAHEFFAICEILSQDFLLDMKSDTHRCVMLMKAQHSINALITNFL
jgi:hypothetical protein